MIQRLLAAVLGLLVGLLVSPDGSAAAANDLPAVAYSYDDIADGRVPLVMNKAMSRPGVSTVIGRRTCASPQIVRKKVGRGQRVPTMPNSPDGLFSQVRAEVPAIANVDQRSPKVVADFPWYY